MAGEAVRVGLPLAVVAVVIAAWLRGGHGALTASFAAMLVVGGFALTGLAHGWAARRSPAALQAVALGGLLARLWVYAVLLVVLRPTDLLDGVTLAVAVPALVVTLLAAEVRFVSVHRELWWLDLAGGPTPGDDGRADDKDRA